MSLFTGLQMNPVDAADPLGAVLCLSGYLPNVLNWKLSPSGAAAPLLMAHGRIDEVVTIGRARKSYQRIIESAKDMKAEGAAERKFVEYADLPHSASEEELDDVIAFIRKHVVDK